MSGGSLPVSFYLSNQSSNPINRFLHGTRYKWIARKLEPLLKESFLAGAPLRVLEIGAGLGKTISCLEVLGYPFEYVGVEPDPEFFSVMKHSCVNRSSFSFHNCTAEDFFASNNRPFDIVIALETLEHVCDDSLPGIIDSIYMLKPQRFFATVPNETGPIIILKTLFSILTGYTRHKTYRWRDVFYAAFGMPYFLPRHEFSHIGFEWTFVQHLIRQRFVIESIGKNPFDFLPLSLSASVYFDSSPRSRTS